MWGLERFFIPFRYNYTEWMIYSTIWSNYY